METRAQIFEKVSTIIAGQKNIGKDQIHEDSTLEKLGADSLDRFEIIMKLEEAFHVAISDEDADKMLTVKDIIDTMSALKKD